jgi:hypothetical protein
MPARATHEGELTIGSGIPCAVLDTGQRILSSRGAAAILGVRTTGALVIANLASRNWLKPHLKVGTSRKPVRVKPVAYRPLHGGKLAQGVEAQTLVDIAKAVIAADRAGDLTSRQKRIADAAYDLIVALAGVGIAALVDEATGYRAELSDDDYVRMFVRQLPAGWTRRFPPSFYTALSQVTGLRPRGHTRPNRWAQLTNQFVYSRLKPSVQAELRRLADQHGARMHQFISEEADRALDALIDTATRCMLAHRSVEPALAMMDKIYPVEGAGVVVAPKGRAANQLMFAFEAAV